LRTLPVLGRGLIVGVGAFRRARQAWEETNQALLRSRTDFKNRRAATASNITRRNTRRAYDRVYRDDRLLNEYLAPGRVAFYVEVAEIVATERPRSVVDVGCGTGNLLREVVERAAPERVVGIDHAAAGVRRAQKLVPSGEFHAQSLYNVRLADTFDLVLCTEVLEHLSDPAAAVDLLNGLCAASGTILITVPDGAQDEWEGHRNFWSEGELKEFLQPYGDVEVSRMRADTMSLLAVVRPRP
jgi:2-polyprenyl-3-methyl-5-hydroxy-6-metoxy-1,4-benzoquinol methylase